MLPCSFKKLLCGQVWRNIRRTVGIYSKNAIGFITILQSNTSILGNCVQVWHIQIEVFSTNFDDRWIDFKSINGNIPKSLSRLPSHCPSCKPNNGHVFYLANLVGWIIKERCHKKFLPGTSV